MNTVQSILMIVTSINEIALGEPTGLWLEELVEEGLGVLYYDTRLRFSSKLR